MPHLNWHSIITGQQHSHHTCKWSRLIYCTDHCTRQPYCTAAPSHAKPSSRTPGKPKTSRIHSRSLPKFNQLWSVFTSVPYFMKIHITFRQQTNKQIHVCQNWDGGNNCIEANQKQNRKSWRSTESSKWFLCQFLSCTVSEWTFPLVPTH